MGLFKLSISGQQWHRLEWSLRNNAKCINHQPQLSWNKMLATGVCHYFSHLSIARAQFSNRTSDFETHPISVSLVLICLYIDSSKGHTNMPLLASFEKYHWTGQRRWLLYPKLGLWRRHPWLCQNHSWSQQISDAKCLQKGECSTPKSFSGCKGWFDLLDFLKIIHVVYSEYCYSI